MNSIAFTLKNGPLPQRQEEIHMAIDPRKRQKKLERRAAKQKAERRQLAQTASLGIASRLQMAASAPILHCCTTEDLWRTGIGQVLVSRQLKGGNVAFVVFLVDVFCLGVKGVVVEIAPRARYDRDLYGKLADRYALTRLTPECARKLVESAVQYALDLGLPPDADYQRAKLIFGDVSAEACSEQFTFGRDGKPFFVRGPHDSPIKCANIIRTLESHCGPGGYHFAVSGGG
jgi:hypothetical protein